MAPGPTSPNDTMKLRWQDGDRAHADSLVSCHSKAICSADDYYALAQQGCPGSLMSRAVPFHLPAQEIGFTRGCGRAMTQAGSASDAFAEAADAVVASIPQATSFQACNIVVCKACDHPGFTLTRYASQTDSRIAMLGLPGTQHPRSIPAVSVSHLFPSICGML